jgi:hypothetical protein
MELYLHSHIRLHGVVLSEATFVNAYEHVNVKVKLSLCLTEHHAMKAYWGSGGIAPLIL